MQTIVIDPGHGGNVKIGGSSANNATSASGVKEKSICLDMARRIRYTLLHGTVSEEINDAGLEIDVVLTRESDENLSLDARASVASKNDATLYLSIHCNGYTGAARGTECWVDRKYMTSKKINLPGKVRSMPGPGIPSSGLRNVNVDDDIQFAKAIVDATVDALKQFDAGAKLRSDKYTKTNHGESLSPPSGVKMKGLGTLKDVKLGTSNNHCRATLLELEFIDNPKVDQLLNGAQSADVRNALAVSISRALVNSL